MEEKEKLNILKRLAAFWLQGAPQMDGGARRLWHGFGKTKKNRETAETPESKFPFMEREGVRTFLPRRTLDAEQEETRQAGRRFLRATGLPEQGNTFLAERDAPDRQIRRKTQTGLLAAQSGMLREKEKKKPERVPFRIAGKETAEDMPDTARMFFWEEPEGYGQKRKVLPFAGGPVRKKGCSVEDATESRKDAAQNQEETAVFWKKEERAAERRQDALPDIDRLMREMTKRLWEEREGCGRRLGG